MTQIMTRDFLYRNGVDPKQTILEASDDTLKVEFRYPKESKGTDENIWIAVSKREDETQPWEEVEDGVYETNLSTDTDDISLEEWIVAVFDQYKAVMHLHPEISIKELGEEIRMQLYEL